MALLSSRRSLLAGLGFLAAAPAIVRVASIMPVKVFDEPFSTDRMRVISREIWPGVRVWWGRAYCEMEQWDGVFGTVGV